MPGTIAGGGVLKWLWRTYRLAPPELLLSLGGLKHDRSEQPLQTRRN